MAIGLAQALEPTSKKIAADKIRRTLFTAASRIKIEMGDQFRPAPPAGTNQNIVRPESAISRAESNTFCFAGVTDASPADWVSNDFSRLADLPV